MNFEEGTALEHATHSLLGALQHYRDLIGQGSDPDVPTIKLLDAVDSVVRQEAFVRYHQEMTQPKQIRLTVQPISVGVLREAF